MNASDKASTTSTMIQQTFTQNLTEIALVFGGLFLLGLVIHLVIRKLFKSTRRIFVIDFLFQARFVTFTLLATIGTHIVLNRFVFTGDTSGFVTLGFTIVYIVLFGWFGLRLINEAANYLKGRYDISTSDNFRARRAHTQIIVLRRLASFIFIVLIVAAILLQFESIRNLGVSILASAGVAGIVLGFAAQKTLGNLIAGIQIALSQPMRVEDAVVVEGEWGWIEEITLTYVVVRIWDLRRLVLPISYFVEKPFQNWTRESAKLLGSVYLYLDYRTPIDAVRKKAQELCEASEYWDNDVCKVQVTDTTEQNIVVRVIATAINSPTAWNLRCELREKLVEWLNSKYPQSLPILRAEIKDAGRPPKEDAQRQEA